LLGTTTNYIHCPSRKYQHVAALT